MNAKQIMALIKKLQKTVKCYPCGTEYSINDIHLLGQIEGLMLMQLNCPKCNNSTWINLAIQGRKEEEPVSEEELISTNEIIDLHNFLVGFDGNFKAVFKNS